MKLVRNLDTEVVHRPDCSSKGSRAPVWTWATGKGLEDVKAASATHPWLHLCRTCLPGCCSCERCRKAKAQRGGLMAQPSPYRRNRDLLPCGTEAAYMRHKRAGEKPCAACIKGASLARTLRKDASARLRGRS